jgi:transposase
MVSRVEQSAAMILEWSSWRRWHQAWARYYHYRRQMRLEVEYATSEAAQEEQVASSVAQQHDGVAIVWQRLSGLLPPSDRVGRPYEYARRLVLEAIVYALQTNCGWRNLPSDFPPWQTVYAQYRQWRKAGIWDKIWSGLKQPHLTRQLQL